MANCILNHTPRTIIFFDAYMLKMVWTARRHRWSTPSNNFCFDDLGPVGSFAIPCWGSKFVCFCRLFLVVGFFFSHTGSTFPGHQTLRPPLRRASSSRCRARTRWESETDWRCLHARHRTLYGPKTEWLDTLYRGISSSDDDVSWTQFPLLLGTWYPGSSDDDVSWTQFPVWLDTAELRCQSLSRQQSKCCDEQHAIVTEDSTRTGVATAMSQGHAPFRVEANPCTTAMHIQIYLGIYV